MEQIDKQIKLCPDCKGWGYLENGTKCSICAQKSVFIESKGKILFFNKPLFVDFGKRKKLGFVKIILLAGLVTFIILGCVASIYIINKIVI